MSLYADYVLERENHEVIESERGFARFDMSGDICYIIDIFVAKEHRRSNVASEMADLITDRARTFGCTKLLGSVDPKTNGATASLKVLLAYGFELSGMDEKLIYFVKDI